ncbi:TetR family transcriptional regulator [Catenulispora yoronensis]|uniref:TetR family transcriptional regulator n=2 Tax=Catenulispora yoronensis TaxID=450799 RepID=A0ABP5FGX6_9ACTN
MPPTDRNLRTLAPLGLRERKKAQTRDAIQRHALRLFRQDGYSATTMEQIAAAADVSPSTLYRYFATKEDLVLQDSYDEIVAAVFRAQPPETPPLEGLRLAVHEVLTSIDPEDRAEAAERARLSFTIPEVRGRALEHMLTTADVIAELFAERLNRPTNSLEVRVLSGSVIGAILGAQQLWITDLETDLLDLTERALQCLIDGPTALTGP